MENPEKEQKSEDDYGFETSFDFRTKGRIGKKTWRKIALALVATATGFFALGDFLRRLLERFWQ